LPRAFDRLRTVSGYERCGPASPTQHEAGPRPRQHAQQFVTVITERYRARRRDLVSRRSTERRNAENETSLSCAMLQDPVQPIPTDEPGRGPQPGVGLCLSGGGYRAMIFHVGVLWRLCQAGVLRSVSRISSVSGGSITAGLLGADLKALHFAPVQVVVGF